MPMSTLDPDEAPPQRHRARRAPLLKRVARWSGGAARAAIWGLTALVLAQYLYVAWHALDYPFQLEWMEGGVLETAARLRAGASIYGPPTIEYVPYIYTPGYFAAVAGASYVTGMSLFTARLVSLLATLGAGWLLYRFAQRETGQPRWGIAAVALYVASFEASGKWLHLARVDSLALLWTLWALYALRFGRGRRSAIAAGVLMALAFLTKQSMVVALAPAGVVMLGFERRRALWAGAVSAALALGSVAALQAATDGWLWYYIYEVAGGHPVVEQMWLDFWKYDLWVMGAALGVGCAGLGVSAARAPRRALFYLALALGFILNAWISRLHSGGFNNVLIPAFAAVALLAALGLGALEAALLARRAGQAEAAALDAARAEAAAADAARGALSDAATRLGLALALGVQLLLLTWPTQDALPPEDGRARGAGLLEHLAGVEGEVLLPDHRYLQTLAGKRSYGLGMASRDLLRVEDPSDRGRRALEASIQDALAEQRFAEVILSEENHMRAWLLPYYCNQSTVEAPAMNTGWRLAPRWVWVPRRAGQWDRATRCRQRAASAADALEQARARGEVRDGPPARIDRPLSARLGETFEVLGYDLATRSEGARGVRLRFTWYLRVLATPPIDYQVFVHLRDATGGRLHGDHDPLRARLPPRRWPVGAVIADTHDVWVPAASRPASFEVFMGAYWGERRLPVTGEDDGGHGRVAAGTVQAPGR